MTEVEQLRAALAESERKRLEERRACHAAVLELQGRLEERERILRAAYEVLTRSADSASGRLKKSWRLIGEAIRGYDPEVQLPEPYEQLHAIVNGNLVAITSGSFRWRIA